MKVGSALMSSLHEAFHTSLIAKSLTPTLQDRTGTRGLFFLPISQNNGPVGGIRGSHVWQEA
jgi:hypothetical protein